MDIDKYLEPEYDFSRLGPIERELMGNITFDEIIYAFENKRTMTYPYPDYPEEENRWFGYGFGNRFRCLEMLIQFSKDLKVSFIDINIADEHGIEEFWCRRR